MSRRHQRQFSLRDETWSESSSDEDEPPVQQPKPVQSLQLEPEAEARSSNSAKPRLSEAGTNKMDIGGPDQPKVSAEACVVEAKGGDIMDEEEEEWDLIREVQNQESQDQTESGFQPCGQLM